MTRLRTRVLVVDDEPPIRHLLRTGLSTLDFAVCEACDGASALKALEERHDLVILDLGLPDMNGLEILEKMRADNDMTPVLILSSRDDEAGKVKAFEIGADDYVTKPFGMKELLARARTALRHGIQSEGSTPTFKVDALAVDLVGRVVRRDGEVVKLSPKEYDLLRIMVLNAGKVLTHSYLLRQVWGSTTDPQQLRVYVRQLRQKIEKTPEQPALVVTETGVGYRLRAPEPSF